MIKVEGKGGISATILADSISKAGVRITTFEIVYPRIVLAELNTHCMLSRASASSRAIPFQKMVESLDGRPVRFGQANPGMQDKGEDFEALVDIGPAMGLSHPFKVPPADAWEAAKQSAIGYSRAFFEAGYAKQIFNRLTEASQMMKTVLTATEFANFFWLRNDGAADPTLHELARCMQEARDQSTPFELQPGQWHTPYVSWAVDQEGAVWWKDENGSHVRTTWEGILKISAARCAAVSFRNVDYSAAKSEEVFARLVGEERKHASAFEHQATPMEAASRGSYRLGIGALNLLDPETWEDGISHMDRAGQLWSGKLRGWVCHRKLIPGENVGG